MKNVTITLDEQVARWARVRAAELDTSVSRMLGEVLKEMMERQRDYELAMNRYLKRKPAMLSETGSEYPSREEVHGRTDLR